MASGVFLKSLLPFDLSHVQNVPRAPGIYIVYSKQTGQPIYIGRSRRDIHERLLRHVTRTGSRKIAEALADRTPLEFEYEHMISPEQAESQLIAALGTTRFFNLRNESDPADWACVTAPKVCRFRQPINQPARADGKAGSCPFCGGQAGPKLYRTKSIFGDEFALHRCLDCRAVFLVPRPSAAQLEQAYDADYYGRGRAKFGPWVEKVLGYFRSSRCRKVGRLVSPPANILDVGCGSGEFARRLVERGYRVCGTELPGKAAERAGQVAGLTLKVGALREGDFGKGYFDAVCMWHVLEHLAEPKKTLDVVGRLLKPGGYLFISLPNIESLQSRLFRGKWLHLDPPRHLFFPGPADLIAEMAKLGFAPAGESHLSIEQNVFGFQQSIVNCLCGRRDMLFEALKGNIEYVKGYARWKIFLQKGFWVATFGLFVGAAALEAALRMGGTVEFVFRKKVT